MERTGGNDASILAQRWPGIIANQYNMQYDIVITRVRMMLVSKPIGSTNVYFDVSHGLIHVLVTYTWAGKRCCSVAAGKAYDGIPHIRSQGTTWAPGEEQLAAIAITQR